MPDPLWAPWRLEYVGRPEEPEGCVFCAEQAGEVAESLVIHRGEHAYVLLNKYPYASGHLLVAPNRHLDDLAALTEAEALELHRLAVDGIGALARLYRPQGHNLGWNLGRVGGAGIVEHIHLHVVPRWGGDTNFMPVLADTKVIPEHLLETRERLREVWGAEAD